MEIPEKFSCIRPEDIAQMAKYASQEGNPVYPVPRLMNARELSRFYTAAAENLEDGIEPETLPEAEPETSPEAEPERESESETQTEPETLSETELQPETELQSEQGAETEDTEHAGQ